MLSYLFAPREKRMLHAIEKATRKKIELMELPTNDLVNERRISKFKQRISDTMESEDLKLFSRLIEEYQQESEKPVLEIAAALAQLLQGTAPFLLQKKPQAESRSERNHSKTRERSGERHRDRGRDRDSGSRKDNRHSKSNSRSNEAGMEQYRLEVGHMHDVTPSNIVGAIANETGIESKLIGRIKISDDHSLVDLPEGLPKALFKKLKTVWVSGQKLNISRLNEGSSRSKPKSKSKPEPKSKPKKQSKNSDFTKPKKDSRAKRTADKKRKANKSTK